MIIMKDFLPFVQKIEKKRWKLHVLTKKIYLVFHQVNSTSLITCSLTKIHNNTYKMSTSVKELTVCQNTFSHVEITTPPVYLCINNYALSTNKKTTLKHCIIKHLNNIRTFY